MKSALFIIAAFILLLFLTGCANWSAEQNKAAGEFVGGVATGMTRSMLNKSTDGYAK